MKFFDNKNIYKRAALIRVQSQVLQKAFNTKGTTMVTAGFFRRIFADFLDSLFVSLFLILTTFFTGSIPEYVLGWLEVFIAFFYFPFFESSQWQRTPGQWCLNMYVCSNAHERISLSRAFYRELMKFILAFPLSIFLTIQMLLFFYFGKYFFTPDVVTIIGMAIVIISGVVGGIVIYYVRFFNNHSQTIRDYVTKSLMMVKVKKVEE